MAKIQKKTTVNKQKDQQVFLQQGKDIFFPLVILTFLLWIFYRLIFNFSVFFDEFIGKAIFFAVPVFFYLAISNDKEILKSFAKEKIKRGLLVGLALGGSFAFVFAILAVLKSAGTLSSSTVYLEWWFWKEFALALLTSFWETLFFFSFILTVLLDRYHEWTFTRKVILTALIFLIFHLPNLFLRFSLTDALLQMILLFSFALGQALFFSKRRNAYSALLIQAIWGMVLLLYY